jgi:hypothetical protein
VGGKWLYRALLAISAITVASGLAQLIRPDLLLGMIGGEATPGARHSFGIVGMFMVLFGSMLLHALLTAGDHSVAVLWAGFKKLGAAGAVGLGVMRGLFGPLALAVAAFDLLSGILILVYRSRSLEARRKRGTVGQGRSSPEAAVAGAPPRR